MNDDLYKKLHADGIISDDSLQKLLQERKAPLFSLHWEIRSLLYIGVLLLTSGLGLLIYKNIDSIGHGFVLLLIAAICGGSLFYCFKNKAPFSRQKALSPNAYFDYILLLGSIMLVTFAGYLQFEYNIFGIHYGMAAFIPMVALYSIAYYFDHLGILSMAIANMAIWMGVSVTPKELLWHNDFNSAHLINIYAILGGVLLLAAFATQHFKFKEHFKFSYQHYAVHILYITTLWGYFYYYNSVFAAVWIVALFLLAFLLYKDGIKNNSFYFLLLTVLYGYVAICCLMTRLFISIPDEGGIMLMLLYYIASAVGLIFFLIHLNKKIKVA